jgi:hypothetical protein
VGTHARTVVEGGFTIRDAWQGAFRAGAERLELAGTGAVTWRVAGLVSRTDVGRVSMLADLDVVEGHGAYVTSMSLARGARRRRASLLRAHRRRPFHGHGISSWRVHPGLALLAGYVDGICAAVVVDWKSIEIATGVRGIRCSVYRRVAWRAFGKAPCSVAGCWCRRVRTASVPPLQTTRVFADSAQWSGEQSRRAVETDAIGSCRAD